MQSKYFNTQGQEGPVPPAELPGAAAGHGRVSGAAHALSAPAEGRAEEERRRRKERIQRDRQSRRCRRKVSRVSGTVYAMLRKRSSAKMLMGANRCR